MDGENWVEVRFQRQRAEKAEAEVKELQATFDLINKAHMRAIAVWNKSHPDNGYVWPDHKDLCVWLMEQLDKKENKDEDEKVQEQYQKLDQDQV